MLEPCEAKVSRTVLRGERSRKAPALPGTREEEMKKRMFKIRWLVWLLIVPVFLSAVYVLSIGPVSAWCFTNTYEDGTKYEDGHWGFNETRFKRIWPFYKPLDWLTGRSEAIYDVFTWYGLACLRIKTGDPDFYVEQFFN